MVELPVLTTGSALMAGILSFASPKESSQRKGDPGFCARLRRVPCATRVWRALRNSGLCPSNSPRAFSASLSVARRATRGQQGAQDQRSTEKTGSDGQPEKQPKNENCQHSASSPGPLRGAEQLRFGWDQGEDCLRGIAPSSAAPHSNRVAQGIPAGDTDPGGAFSLATFFWRSKRKYARPQGGIPCKKTDKSQSSPHTTEQAKTNP